MASDTVQSGRKSNILPVSLQFNIQDYNIKCQHIKLQLRKPQQFVK